MNQIEYSDWARVCSNPRDVTLSNERLKPHEWYAKWVSAGGPTCEWAEYHGVIIVDEGGNIYRSTEVTPYAFRMLKLPDGSTLSENGRYLVFPRWREHEVARLFNLELLNAP
jgi:hypothetical protein